MYKSYSSTAKVDKDSRVVISEFKAASVKLDVQLSGFPTSYSYYVANEEGSGITSKDVAKANATANDWIGAGKATYTITREGIPSTLLKFESFKLTVDGVEQPAGTETDKTISFDGGNGYTTWGQKDIVATVTYTNLATGAPETASDTLTRHITGLPYSANPPKSSEWKDSGHNIYFENSYVQMGKKGIDVGLEKYITKEFNNIPSSIDITVKSSGMIHGERFGLSDLITNYVMYLNDKEIAKEVGTTSDKTYSISANTSMSVGNNTIKCESTYTASRPYVRVNSVNIEYR